MKAEAGKRGGREEGGGERERKNIKPRILFT